MTWESRGNRTYYYQKVWRNGTCHSEYVGAGAIANLSAAIDACAHHNRTWARHEWEDTLHTQRAVDERLNAFRRQVCGVVAAALQQAGYHQHHRGEWRKRRGEVMPDEIERATVPTGIGILAQSVLGEVLRCGGLTSPDAKKALLAELSGLRTRLGWAESPPHEQLLIEAIALSWLRLQLVEQLHSMNSTENNYKISTVEHFERRLSAAHRRYIEATLALSRVRRLGVHVQINVANQQVVQNG